MLKQLLLALKRLLRALGPVLVGCIFLGAVYLLYREISKYSLADIRMSLAQISTEASSCPSCSPLSTISS